MKSANTYLENKNKDKLTANLKQEYAKVLKKPNFLALINKLELKENIAIKYTSKLEKTADELHNCQECPGLSACSNSLLGYVYYPNITQTNLLFTYRPCKYQKNALKKEKKEQLELNSLPIEIQNASMKDIDTTDKNRYHVIKWLKEFLSNYGKSKVSGLYLHGSFGSGKTYLIAAALNELKKKDINVVIIYFANFLRNLKEAMENYSFSDKMNEVLNAEVLLIDDIGAEALSSWSRDEILGSILQHRMDNNLVTFLTSNLNIEELEAHLTFTKGKEEKVKARRIIERIKFMTNDLELISINRRN